MKERNKKHITVLIPCYNEAQGIAAVIESFPTERLAAYKYEVSILVIDNNSTDNTADVALAHGAEVLSEPKKGKGNAMRRGFQAIAPTTDFVVMLDGDNTYRPQEMLRLIELIDSGFCSVVLGSRLGGRTSKGAMNAVSRAGNWLFSHLVRVLYRVNVTDVLTGYFAWKREALEKLRPHLASGGFAIEMEMVTKMAKLGEEIYCVPITYEPRVGQSHLRPFYDGTRILWMLTRNLFWRPRPDEIRLPVEQLSPSAPVVKT